MFRPQTLAPLTALLLLVGCQAPAGDAKKDGPDPFLDETAQVLLDWVDLRTGRVAGAPAAD